MDEHTRPPGPTAISWTPEEGDRLWDEWRFNCGPAALCAVTTLTPQQLRPHMLDFEHKGYTSPTLMRDVLKKLRVEIGIKSRYLKPAGDVLPWPRFGLARVQWDGPWCKSGVPMAARYRHTHWVASYRPRDREHLVFDVNATCVGGWVSYREWSLGLVPWLLKEAEPKATGGWWLTHAIEVRSAGIDLGGLVAEQQQSEVTDA